MLYLSHIVLDTHSRTVGRALTDLYALHQLVYSAFTDANPETLGRILFRLDTNPAGEAALLVQSHQAPIGTG